jgi:Glycosyltransferase family 87
VGTILPMTAPTAADALRAPARPPVVHRDWRAPVGRIGAIAGRVAAPAALAGLVLLMMRIATGAVATPSLVQLHRNALPGWLTGVLPATGALTRVSFTGLLVAMLGCWAVALLAARRLPWRIALGGIVLLHVVAMLAPPMVSTDVFNYIDYGRLGVIHAVNPYTHGPVAAPFDPAFKWTGPLWIHTPTVYGPIFTLLSYAIAPLGVAGALWAFKAIAALCSIGIVLCVAAAARALGRDPVRPALAMGANPLIVLYAVAGAHNDLLMALGVAAGALLLIRGRELSGAGTALAGAAVKLTAIVAVPFLVLGSRNRLRTALLTAGATAAAAGFTYLVFGRGPFDIGPILAHHERIGEYGSAPGWVATRLGLAQPGHHARSLLHVATVAIVLACLAVALFRRSAWLSAGAIAVLAVLLLSTSFYPWYLALALPLAALAPSRTVRMLVPAVTAFVLLMRTGHVLFGWHNVAKAAAHHHLHRLR